MCIRDRSGGNMQKLVVARELSNNFPLIIIENPTWGIDVGSIAFIHQKILDMKARGAAILLVSNELDEIDVLADSALVMYEGKISNRIPKDTKFRENIASNIVDRACPVRKFLIFSNSAILLPNSPTGLLSK